MATEAAQNGSVECALLAKRPQLVDTSEQQSATRTLEIQSFEPPRPARAAPTHGRARGRLGPVRALNWANRREDEKETRERVRFDK